MILIELTSRKSQGARVYCSSGLSVTLSAQGGGMGANTGIYLIKNDSAKGYLEAENGDSIAMDYPRSKTKRGRVGKGISPTLKTWNHIAVVQRSNARRLTPCECFRLMGFNDGDFAKASQQGLSDTQLYKQAGNSIVVNVLMGIFGELYGVEWQPKVYGDHWKTEEDRLQELPLFKLLN